MRVDTRYYLSSTQRPRLEDELLFVHGTPTRFPSQAEARRVAADVLKLTAYGVWHQDSKGRNRRVAEVSL